MSKQGDPFPFVYKRTAGGIEITCPLCKDDSPENRAAAEQLLGQESRHPDAAVSEAVEKHLREHHRKQLGK